MAGMALSDPATHAEVAERLSARRTTMTRASGARCCSPSPPSETRSAAKSRRCIERAKRPWPAAALTARRPRLLVVMQCVLLYADELDLALRVMREARSLAEEHGAPGELRARLGRDSRVLHDMGRLLEAEADARRPGRSAPRTSPSPGPMRPALAKVLLKRGDLAAAETALSEAGFDRSTYRGRCSRPTRSPPMALSTWPKVIRRRHWPTSSPSATSLSRRGAETPPSRAGDRGRRSRWSTSAAGRGSHPREEELELSKAWGAPTMIGRSLRASASSREVRAG